MPLCINDDDKCSSESAGFFLLLYFSLFSLDTVKSLHGIISFVLAM